MGTEFEVTVSAAASAESAALPAPRAAADPGPVTAPIPLPALAQENWQRRYATTVAAADLTIVTGVICATVAGVFGSVFNASHDARLGSGIAAFVLVVAALTALRAWDERILGAGSVEFKRLGRAVGSSAVALALVGLLFEVRSIRLWVFVVLPVIGALCFLSRWALRKFLHRARGKGRCMQPVLAVGSPESVSDLITRTRRDTHFGWDVVGACTSTGLGIDDSPAIDGVPVLGDLDAINAVVGLGMHRVVAVAPTPGWGAPRLHRLAWQLEGTRTELAVDPGLMEIAGPRLHITPVDGLPMLRLTQPRFTGVRRMLKHTLDRVGAALLLLLAAPTLLAIAVAIKLDGGPVFFRQERVGVNGTTFRMVKFRSMVVDAEARKAELTAANEGAGPLFKMKDDPRITPVGRWLRRYSIDEVPQLFNVLTGRMSLVGPRPPLQSEVDAYADAARRRLLVRPGMTGLWQVSGRSDLTWEESVRLDLRYVENWSMALDATILWKTVGTVLGARGAY